MRKMLRLLLISFLSIPLSLSADELVRPQDFPTAHRVIQLVDGGVWSAEFRYTLADSELVIEHRDPKAEKGGRVTMVRTLQKRIHLDAAATKAAWDLIAKLEVRNWKEHYRPEDLNGRAFEGTRWVVYLRCEGVDRYSGGYNVYPSLSPLGAPTWDQADEHGRRIPNAYSELLLFLQRFEKGLTSSDAQP